MYIKYTMLVDVDVIEALHCSILLSTESEWEALKQNYWRHRDARHTFSILNWFITGVWKLGALFWAGFAGFMVYGIVPIRIVSSVIGRSYVTK